MGDEADLEIRSIDTQAHGSKSLRVKPKYACIAQEDELASSSRETSPLSTCVLFYRVLQYSRTNEVIQGLK
jgi:hypothetical protein